LMDVILNDELEKIGEGAFNQCRSLQRIVIPNAVKRIKDFAFAECGLTTVILCEGLEEIGSWTFYYCEFLQSVVIPNSVKAIKENAFYCSMQLTAVTLGEGLEKIGRKAFYKCTSLERIMIPPIVKEIHHKAFKRCFNLRSVEFCNEIEVFVSCEAMRVWWNQGVHVRSLSTYCFLVKCNIPVRLGLVRVQRWQAIIYEMLNRIPSIHPRSMNSYFRSIESELTLYENLKDSPALLELAIWKSKITEQYGHDNHHHITNMHKKRRTDSVAKSQCRTDSVAMVRIIVPNVISFLTYGTSVGNSVVDDNDGGEEAIIITRPMIAKLMAIMIAMMIAFMMEEMTTEIIDGDNDVKDKAEAIPCTSSVAA
jgi:hypothetical protein